jgi:hypothetical protein
MARIETLRRSERARSIWDLLMCVALESRGCAGLVSGRSVKPTVGSEFLKVRLSGQEVLERLGDFPRTLLR